MIERDRFPNRAEFAVGVVLTVSSLPVAEEYCVPSLFHNPRTEEDWRHSQSSDVEKMRLWRLAFHREYLNMAVDLDFPGGSIFVAGWTDLLRSAQAQQRAGQFSQAEAFFEQARAAAPSEPAVHHLFGLLRMQQKRFEEAEELLRAACEQKLHPPEALMHHALSLAALRRLEEALAILDRLVILKPEAAGAWNNRAEVLADLTRYDEALEDFNKATAINPRFAHALEGKGAVLLALTRYHEALSTFEKALAIQPRAVGALVGRSRALLGLHRPGEAMAVLDHALTLAPDNSDIWFHRGVGLEELGYFEEALCAYERAIAIHPDGLGARNNRCVVLQRLKRYRDAAQGYEEMLSWAPDSVVALNGRANCALYSCDWRNSVSIKQRMRVRIQHGAVMQLGTVLGYFSEPAIHLSAARNYVKPLFSATRAPLWRAPRFGGKRIRLAYCSGNFNSHPMPRLLAGMFEHHDRDKFEVLAISFGPDDQSDMRRRLVEAFDEFYDVANKSDSQIAEELAELEVDIAVDLMGHTNGSRTSIFAARPAPVQVNYMGFPGTLGADFYDYIIGDPITLPVEHQAFYSEKIVQLPDSYLANDDRREIPFSTLTRTKAGLPEAFVFCCFNNNWKITAPVFAIWMRLLREVSHSVLWLLEDNSEAADNLRGQAEASGVNADRLIFAARTSPEEHLARHTLADLFLDTLPYNAHTTASDSLWAGIPLVTVIGRAFHSRVAASALSAVGLSELIAKDLKEYENIARKLASNPDELKRLRRKLALNRTRLPLFDTVRFTRHMESAYKTMSAIFREGGTPHGFKVAVSDNSAGTPV